MPRNEEQAARLLERLLTDRDLRSRFRRDPAAVAREAGVEELVAEDFSGSAMSTLEVRESRSSLAGVLMAAAVEGFAGFGLSGASAAGARDLTPNVDRWVARLPPPQAGPPVGNGASAGAPGLATPERVAAEQASWDQQGPWTERSAGNAADLAQPQPGANGANGAGAPVAPEPSGRVAPAPTGRAAFTPPDPTDYGMGGTGGKPTAEALALLDNPKVKFLDAGGPKDLRSGRMDPRVVDIVTRLAADHRVTLSALASNHDKFSAGGGISNHWYGRAVDVAGVDGQAVGPGNAVARKVAESLMKLPPSIRPTEVGSPWQISAPGYFSDADHQNHIHIAFDDAISRDWKPPAGTKAPSSGDAGVFAVVDPTSAPPAPVAAPPPVAAPASAAPPPVDPASAPDGPDQPDGSQDTNPSTGLEDPGGDTNAEADQESDVDSVGDDEGEGDSSGGSDGEGDEGDGGSDGGGGPAPSEQPAAAPAPAGPAPDVAPVVLDDTGLPPLDDSTTPPVDGTTPSPDQGGGAGDAPAVAVDGAGGGGGYPGDGASGPKIAAWMAGEAKRRGLPPELPLMASLVESGMKNLSGGDADSVGFFQMRTSIWDQGPYAGYEKKPELQLKWFLDKALEMKKQRLAQGQSVTDPNSYGEWIADVERPAAQYRGRYQLRLREARALLAAGAVGQDPAAPAGGGHLVDAVSPPQSGGGGGGGGGRAVQLALKEVGTRESGNNAGGAEKYQRVWGASPGQPWCGYFVGAEARSAGAQGLTSRVGYVPNIITDGKARTNGFVGWTADPKQARPGDFVVLFGGSHVEMVKSVNPDGSVNTIGGNTSLDSGGEGVAEKRRSPGDIVGFARPNYR